MSIAILGMVLGWGSVLSIGVYVYNEFSYDHYHEKGERIYRITHSEMAGEIPGTRHLATVGPPMGPALKNQFSQVQDFVRFRYHPNVIFKKDDLQYYEHRVFFADPSVFNMFSFNMKRGNPSTALSLANNVVITQSMAAKYFGTEDPLGKTITMNGNTELLVSAVLEDVPDNSHLKFDFLIPFEAFKVPYGFPVTLESWGWLSFHTYVLLGPDENVMDLEAQLPSLVKEHWPEERARRFKLELQPLHDIYLGSVLNDHVASGNKSAIYVLGGAGLLIMVIAIFNFSNLFAVITISRAKEVGMRKLLGATRANIFGRLQGETLLLTILSLLTTLLLAPLWSGLLPWDFAPDQIATPNLVMGTFLLIIFALLIGFISGLYPSRLLASNSFKKLLGGTFKTSATGIFIRKTMLSGQFVVSIALIVCVMVISRQIDFIKTKDLGFAKDELLLLRMPGEQLARRYPQLKERLDRIPYISAVSVGGGRMDGENGNVPIYTAGVTDEFGKPMAIDAISFDFFKTIGVSLLAGREFTLSQPSDTLRGVLLNAMAAKEFGWTPEDALGKPVRIGDILLDGEVIGVVPDFNFGSLHTTVKPLVMSYHRTQLQDIYIRFDKVEPATLISSVQSEWQVIAPDIPFDYAFLNLHLESLYRTEQLFSTMFRFFASVAIAIACLGLYALINQDILYRTKEIGVRKILGASVVNIVGLILRQFCLLIVIANVIAWPLAYFFMSQWLREFAYHTELHWMTFLVAGATALLMALVTVGYNSVKTALANPVSSIKNE